MCTISKVCEAERVVIVVDVLLNEAVSLADFQTNGWVRLVTTLVELEGTKNSLEEIDFYIDITSVAIA